MSPAMVLNDLSHRNLAPDIYTARAWMNCIVGTIRAATTAGTTPGLKTSEEFNNLLLAPEYPISRWRNDADVNIETRRFLRSAVTKLPLLNSLGAATKCSEFKYKNEYATGLGAAATMEGLAISFASDAEWDTSDVNVVENFLEGNATEIESELHVVKHASKSAHIQQHTQWINDRNQNSVASGTDLWERRAQILPGLQFCDRARDALLELQNGNVHLYPIQKKLTILSKYAREWTTGPFNAAAIGCKTSSESDQTIQQYSEERTIPCPDGTSRLFKWHVRATPEAWRIHFYPMTANTDIIIGYIGPKLRTVTDPT